MSACIAALLFATEQATANHAPTAVVIGTVVGLFSTLMLGGWAATRAGIARQGTTAAPLGKGPGKGPGQDHHPPGTTRGTSTRAGHHQHQPAPPAPPASTSTTTTRDQAPGRGPLGQGQPPGAHLPPGTTTTRAPGTSTRKVIQSTYNLYA